MQTGSTLGNKVTQLPVKVTAPWLSGTLISWLGDDGVAGRAIWKHKSHRRQELGLGQTSQPGPGASIGTAHSHGVHTFVLPASHVRAAGEQNSSGLGTEQFRARNKDLAMA